MSEPPSSASEPYEGGEDPRGRLPAPVGSDPLERQDVDFAPADPTDGRRKGEWKTVYTDGTARRRQLIEGLYLGVLLAAAPVALFLIWNGNVQEWLVLTGGRAETLRTYGLAWIAGLLGGTVFATKWLYHSVAHGFWHQDRLLWRLFTPHLSAAFAFGLLALVTSGLIGLIDAETLRRPAPSVGVAFLFGYFSDFTVAALARTARQLLGGEDAQRAISLPQAGTRDRRDPDR